MSRRPGNGSRFKRTIDPRARLAIVSRPNASAPGERCCDAERMPTNAEAQSVTVTSPAPSASSRSRSAGRRAVVSSVATMKKNGARRSFVRNAGGTPRMPTLKPSLGIRAAPPAQLPNRGLHVGGAERPRAEQGQVEAREQRARLLRVRRPALVAGSPRPERRWLRRLRLGYVDVAGLFNELPVQRARLVLELADAPGNLDPVGGQAPAGQRALDEVVRPRPLGVRRLRRRERRPRLPPHF